MPLTSRRSPIKNMPATPTTLQERAEHMLLLLSVMTDEKEKLALVINNFQAIVKQAKKSYTSDDGSSYQGHNDFGNSGILGGRM